MSYADRAAEHRRVWLERADTAEQLAAQHPGATARPYLLKMARQARRQARWPYWAVWAVDRAGHWVAQLLILVGLWVWLLASGTIRDASWLSWVVAGVMSLVMGANAYISYRLPRQREEELRRLQERRW